MPREFNVKQPTSVIEGDELYFQHPTRGVSSAQVRSVGKHGVRVADDEAPEGLPVRWEHVLGHKARAQRKLVVIDKGEDGSIAEDESGKRVYINGRIPGDAPQGGNAPLAKSFEFGAVATPDDIEPVLLAALEAGRGSAELAALIHQLIERTARTEALLQALVAKFGIQSDSNGVSA
jgi:hypothetical protein